MVNECTRENKGHIEINKNVSPRKYEKHPQSMTQHDYLTQMANEIIDEDIGKELNYRQ